MKKNQGAQLNRYNIGEVELATRVYHGDNEAILFIHGSWDDHQAWDGMISTLTTINHHTKIVYDRRGHSASTNIVGQGQLSQDVADAIGILQILGVKKAHIVGHSYGANIAMSLAQRHPGVIKSLFLYEPPLFGLLHGTPELQRLQNAAKKHMLEAVKLIENGHIEQGAIHFAEQVAFGNHSWQRIFDERTRACMLANADTWLDQSRDPERLEIGFEHLHHAKFLTTLGYGSQTLPTFAAVVDIMRQKLPLLQMVCIAGAGHGAPLSHSNELAHAIHAHILESQEADSPNQ